MYLFITVVIYTYKKVQKSTCLDINIGLHLLTLFIIMHKLSQDIFLYIAVIIQNV